MKHDTKGSQSSLFVVKQESRKCFAKFGLGDAGVSASPEEVAVCITFPTPVGPKNIIDATGRLGACRPAREIRTASLIACTTWSCPTTRLLKASSIFKVISSGQREGSTGDLHEPTFPSPERSISATSMVTDSLLSYPLHQVLNRNPSRLCNNPCDII